MNRARTERTQSKKWRGSVRRLVCATIYNLSCFTHGCSTGWVAGVLGEQALAGGAWLAALPCLVALPAAPFFVVLADARGRKAGACCIAFSFIVSWAAAAWCGTRGVWASRAAAGAGGAGALALAPVYSSEIAPRTKGLVAMPGLACSSGILFAYCAGGVLTPQSLSVAMLFPAAALLIALLWLPETPAYLINTGKVQDAATILCWFDGSDFREDMSDVIEEQEVRIRTGERRRNRHSGLYRQNSDTMTPMLKRSSGLDSSVDRNETSACRELFRHRRSRRALFSCFALITASAATGVGAVNSFAAGIIRGTTPEYGEEKSFNSTITRHDNTSTAAGSVLCAVALVLGAAAATCIVDKFGRKVLLLWSCSGIACCLALLGAYCDPRLRTSWSNSLLNYHRSTKMYQEIKHVKDVIVVNETMHNVTVSESNSTLITIMELSGDLDDMVMKNVTENKDGDSIWPPVLLLSMLLFLYNIGLGLVPYILITELFSMQVRSLASSVVMSWMWLTSFLQLRYYNTIVVSLGHHVTYYISASLTLLGALYIYLCLPETKGRSQKDIDDDLGLSLLGGIRKRQINEET